MSSCGPKSDNNPEHENSSPVAHDENCQTRADQKQDHAAKISRTMALDNAVLYAAIMLILPDAIEAIESGGHYWVTIQRGHEEAFKALLNTAAAGGQFLYTPVSEIHLHGLSAVQQVQLLQGRDGLIYRDKHGAVFALEELRCEVEDAVARIAPTATIQHRIAVSLRFDDPNMIEKLRTGLSGHPSLNYVEIEFGED